MGFGVLRWQKQFPTSFKVNRYKLLRTMKLLVIHALNVNMGTGAINTSTRLLRWHRGH